MQRIALFLMLLAIGSAGKLNASLVGDFTPPGVQSMKLSKATLHLADNTDGSCVQCALTHCGYHCNEPAAAMLLVNSEFGPAIRGGSTPSRVSSYCNARHIPAWNITGFGDGKTTGTLAWMRWAVKTGRFAAIGADRAHFQTLWGYDYSRQKWLVVNNQIRTKMRVDEYDEDAFIRLHMASGPWIVVLQKSSSENPELVEWWK